MVDHTEIEIPFSKSKWVVMAIGSIIFTGFGIWLAVSPPSNHVPIIGSPMIGSIVGIGGSLFFGVICFILFRKLGDRKPGLIISNEGIIDHSSGVSVGFVPWSDVTVIREITLYNRRFINLVVKNPQSYIDKQVDVFIRNTMQINQNSFGCAICISAKGLDASYEELKELINDKFQASKGHSVNIGWKYKKAFK